MRHSIGRIAFHAPDWKWISLEDGYENLNPGDLIQVRYHPAVDPRKGTATVLHQDGARVYVRDGVWFDAIPAVADLDYVYRVEPP